MGVDVMSSRLQGGMVMLCQVGGRQKEGESILAKPTPLAYGLHGNRVIATFIRRQDVTLTTEEAGRTIGAGVEF